MIKRKCIECGTYFVAKKEHARFCSTRCRKAFNNRRMTRGAELYDIFMALRYERKWAQAVGAWQLICRLVSVWRQQDEREGRKSYITPRQWVEDNRARLRADTWQQAAKRR